MPSRTRQGLAGGRRRGPRPDQRHDGLRRPRRLRPRHRGDHGGPAAKLEMWREVDEIVKPEAIFATNTSSLAVIAQAAATSRPASFVGLHYFNPAQVMKLVEVIRAVTTCDEAFETAEAFAKSQGKLAVPTRDSAGFIVNRLLVPYMLDAIRALRGGRRVGRRDRRGDEGRRGASDGAAHARGLRRARHPGIDQRGHVRRVPRAPRSRPRRRCARC